MTSQAALKGSHWGELAPVRATERGLLFSRLQIALGWANPLSVIATRCHLSPRRGYLLPNFYLSQPFRLLANLATSFFSPPSVSSLSWIPPLVAYGDSRPRAPSLALRAIHLVPQGGTKKVSASLPSCLPLGEGAERSEAEGGQHQLLKGAHSGRGESTATKE